jgi:hypothetical protein
MLISVLNRTRTLSGADVHRAVRAINRQFAEDFEPHWQFGARLRLDGAEERGHRSDHDERIATSRLPGRRGDGVIYLLDEASIADAEGYHDRNADDVPYGFVFLDVCRKTEETEDGWTIALSHEAIELAGDPLNNLLVQGPHPENGRHLVFHMFELCDPVQDEHYELDGVKVSNFVLPGYFTRGNAADGRNDFLGRRQRGQILPSFGVAPGGYLCYYDAELPDGRKWHSFFRGDDEKARLRLDAKQTAGHGRIERRRCKA